MEKKLHKTAKFFLKLQMLQRGKKLISIWYLHEVAVTACKSFGLRMRHMFIDCCRIERLIMGTEVKIISGISFIYFVVHSFIVSSTKQLQGIALPDSLYHLHQTIEVKSTRNMFESYKFEQPVKTMTDIRTRVCAELIEVGEHPSIFRFCECIK